jgi:hypothetical protein
MAKAKRQKKTRWEHVEGSGSFRTERLAIPGGWLYAVHGNTTGIVFVPFVSATQRLLAGEFEITSKKSHARQCLPL